MRLPDVIKSIILDYYYNLIHSEKLDSVHCEMLMKHYILFPPRRYLSFSYFLMLQ